MEQQSTASNGRPEHAPQQPAGKNVAALLKNKKVLIIAGAVLLLLAGTVAAMTLSGGKDEPRQNTGASNTSNQSNRQSAQQTSSNDPFAQQYLQGCSDRKASFTATPVPIDQMGYLEPLGKMFDGHVTPTDHVYIAPKNLNAADNTTDVVMPADGTVINIAAMPSQYIGDTNQQTANEDHRVVIAHNCQYVSIFIHIHQLSDKLKTALGGPLEPNANKQVSIELKAGEKLGKIGGNPVDWSLMDAKQKLSFITPDLYKGESWKIHVIDPVSVYSGSLKDQLIAKSLRSSEPYGGKIDHDKRGALAGNWFREGTNGYSGADQSRYWDGHLSVVPDYLDSGTTVVSLGNWDGKAKQFMVKGNADPSAVTKASGPVKYELVDVAYVTADGRDWHFGAAKGIKGKTTGTVRGTVMLQVLDGEKLKVERFAGKTAAQVSDFSSAAQTFER